MLYSEMLWEINLWILILVKLKLQNLITTLFVYCLDYLLIKCSCKFTFVQSFLNTYSLHYYPFRSHLPMYLFGNFITNTSLAWKYSISWNKTEGYLLFLLSKGYLLRFTRTRLLGQSRIWDMCMKMDLFSSFWPAKPCTTLWIHNISPLFKW
jgi:hypothetical protein